jgi:hypothetical protein
MKSASDMIATIKMLLMLIVAGIEVGSWNSYVGLEIGAAAPV